MDNKLKSLLEFVEFTNLFADIKRSTILNKDGSPENDAQHSFQLAIVGWYISSKENLDLSVEKIIKYSLVHDLVETYSGTFPAYSRNSKSSEIKLSKEIRSLEKIKRKFSNFSDLIESIDQYMMQVDSESKFIYSLDKLLPVINIEVNNHDFYFKTETTYEDMIKVKDRKISMDPIVYGYFKLLRKYLKEESKFFWPDNKDRDYSNKVYKVK